MAEANGNWVNNGYNLYRVLLRTSGTIIIAYGEIASGASYSGSVNLVRAGSWGGSEYVAFSGGAGTRELYRQDVGAVSGTFTASITGNNGTSTASISVDFRAPSVPLPGKPTNVAVTRPAADKGRVTWTKGSNATSVNLTANRDQTGWYQLVEGNTGTSQDITWALDTHYRFGIHSVNAAGMVEAVVFTVFTKPKTPTTPVLAAGEKASWTLPSKYKHGVQIQRSDNAGSTVTTYDQGAVTEWTDPVAQSPLSQYRVRVWVGPSLDEAKTYSDWSAWSDTVMRLTYKQPAVTKLDAYRCTSAGVKSETGTYLRVVSSGTVSKVPNASNVETNKVTRKVAYRKVGTTTWTEKAIVTNAAPNDWTDAGATIGDGLISETSAWEVRYTVQDAYSTVIPQALLVPVAQVPFSIGPSGTSHGKAWERGALDIAGDVYLDGKKYLMVDGVPRPLSGTGSVPSTPAFTAYGTVYARTVNLDPPYTPPPGYYFNVWAATTTGHTIIGPVATTLVGGKIPARHIQIGNASEAATTRFGWELKEV